MANIRTLDYMGFNAASSSLGTSGWMFWSGSKTLTGSGGAGGVNTDYDGIGFEAVLHSESYFRYSASTAGAGLEMRTDTFFLGSTDSFISGSGDGTIALSSSNFELSAGGSVTMQGTITATAGGTIGGWTIGSDYLESGPMIIDSGDAFISSSAGDKWMISSSADTTDPAGFISSSLFKVRSSGQLTASAVDISGKISATSGDVGGWGIQPDYIAKVTSDGGVKISATADPSIAFRTGSHIDTTIITLGDLGSNKYGIKALDSATATNTIFKLGEDGNEIAGWSFDNGKLTSGPMMINATDAFISSSAGDKWQISSSADTTDPTGFISSSLFKVRSSGQVTASDVQITGKITATSGDIAGWTIGSTNIYKVSSTGGISIDTAQPQINFRTGSHFDTRVIAIGDIGTDQYGIIGWDSTDTSKTLFKLGEDGNEIAGWTINSDSLKSPSNYLVLDSANQAISIYQSTYGTTGIQLQNNSGTPRAFIGKGDGEHIKFDGSSLFMSSSEFYMGSDTQYISGAEGNIEISSSYFHLDNSGNVSMAGIITANEGAIGGWAIGGTTLTSGPMMINSANAFISSSAGDKWVISSSADSTDEAGFISSSLFKVRSSGQVTASSAKITGNITANTGQIGGWDIQAATLTSGPMMINSTNAFISSSAGDKWVISSSTDSSDPTGFISSSLFKVRPSGQITGSQVLFTGGRIAGWSINNNEIYDDGSKVYLSSQNKSIYAHPGGTGNDTKYVNLGQTHNGTGYTGYYGVSAVDGNNNFIFRLDDAERSIAGWNFDNEKLQGGQMIIKKDGTIESDGFASNVAGTGFRLTAASGGFLEVENARIRGTLSTAVFEKESVNAVGGQLYIANSTMLTGSTFVTTLQPSGYTSSEYPANETTMSVVNVTGFAVGEILTAKKMNSTGFATEYMKIESSSRFATSENDLAGAIYVERGLGTSFTGNSGSLGDSGSSAQSYSGSQVIVSTGKVGTGYIRLNANPNDPYTPYIDIVERTGSDVYDVDLKARLGDLSGITDYSFSDGVTGYGLYTGNGYFKGKIEVSSIASPPAATKLVHHYKFNGVSGSQFLSASNAAFRNDGTGDNKSPVSASGYYDSTPNTDPVSQSYYTDGVFGTAALIKCRPESFRFKDHPAKFGPVNNNSGSISWWQRVTKFNYDSLTNRMGGGFGYAGDSYDSFMEVGYNKLRCQDTDGSSYELYNPIDPETGVYAINHTASAENGNTWYHFVVNFTGTGMEIYRNGVKGTGANWGDASDGIVFDRIGHAYGQNLGQLPFATSSFDDVRIYDSVLTENEIQGLYTNADGGGTIIDGGRISTGRIVSNNWNSNNGSEFDLDKGTIKLGGSLAPDFAVDETGTVTASAGLIGGWEISSSFLSSSDGGFMINSDATGGSYRISSSNFQVNDVGAITASAGHIADWKILPGTLTSGPMMINSTDAFISSSAGDGWVISSSADDTDTIGFISSSKFKVSTDGRITGSQVLFTGGDIGPLNIDPTKLYVGTGTWKDANTAFYVDNTGAFSLKDKFSWDGNNLSVNGEITIGAGSTTAVDFGAAAALSASNAAAAAVAQSASLAASQVAASASLAATATSFSSSAAATSTTIDGNLTTASSSLAATSVAFSSSAASTAATIDSNLTTASSSLAGNLVSASSSLAATTTNIDANLTSASSSLAATSVAFSSSAATQANVLSTAASASAAVGVAATLATAVAHSTSFATTTETTIENLNTASSSLALTTVNFSASAATQAKALSDAASASAAVGVASTLATAIGHSQSLAATTVAFSSSAATQANVLSTAASASAAVGVAAASSSLALTTTTTNTNLTNASSSLAATTVAFSSSAATQANVLSTAASASAAVGVAAASSSLAATSVAFSSSAATQANTLSTAASASAAVGVAAASSSLAATSVAFSSSAATQANALSTAASASAAVGVAAASASLATTSNTIATNLTNASSSLAATGVANSSSLAGRATTTATNLTNASSSLAATGISFSSSLAATGVSHSSSLAATTIAFSSSAATQANTLATAASASAAVGVAATLVEATNFSASNAAAIVAASASLAATTTANNALIPNNNIGLITMNGTPAGAGLYLGAENLGYFDSGNWTTYMSSSGDFFLTGSSGGYMNWDSSTGKLGISGSIIATDGHIGGFGITTAEISSSNDALRLKANGDITGSQVKLFGGDIGGWTINSNQITSGSSEDASTGDGVAISLNATPVAGGTVYRSDQTRAKGLHIQTHRSSNASSLIVGEIISDANGQLDTGTPAFNSWYGIQGAKWNDNTPYFQLAFKGTGTSFVTNNSIAGWEFDREKLQSGITDGGRTILKANGQITASSLLLSGSCTATNFATRVLNVSSGNMSSYRSQSHSGTRNYMLFDGSGGGERGMYMRITSDPGTIWGFKTVLSDSSVEATVVIDCAYNGGKFDDGAIYGGNNTMAAER
jgi:hypothetical protein